MVRRLRRLPPPPSENTLLVKDDTQDGGLGWKKVGNVIKDAKTAGQVINATNADRILRNVPANMSSDLIKVTSDTAKFCSLVIGSSDSGASISVETDPTDSGTMVEIRQKGVRTLTSSNGVCNINGTAKYARYASSDTSKGTIEERLTNLGFKEGTVTPLPTSTCGSSSLKRQGNYIIGYIKEIKFSAANDNAFRLPDWAHPKEYLEMKQIAPISVSSSGMEYQSIIITITPDGFVRTDRVPFATTNIDIYFGYEANPL